MKTQTQKLNITQNRIPAEWEAQAALWTAWPSHPDLWQEDLEPARGEIAQMIRAVADGQRVNVLVMGNDAAASAKNMLGSGVEIFDTKFGDIWLRDTGPIFTSQGAALRFKNNGWGGKYELPFDNEVGDFIVQAAGVKAQHFDFILEGGALEHDGQGRILTTRQCVLNKNRNGWEHDEAEELLRDAFNASDILWLDDGLLNDHTDGHIDNIARFIGPCKVLCQSAFGDDDPNAALYSKIASDLKDMGLEVFQIPSPGLIQNDGEIVPASHMNFIIANEAVVVPTYGTASADKAVGILADMFPKRKVIGAGTHAILTGGGSFHCITQQQPVGGAS